MSGRRRGYFPRLGRLMTENGISVPDVVAGSGLTEKSVRRMINRTGYSLFTSVDAVVVFLNTRGCGLDAEREFAEAT